MIAFVEGRVVTLAPDSAVVQAGGVGYRIFCGPATLGALREGSDARLYTYHLVREDLQALYGFRSTEELGFFELLTTVTGVGPKVALSIVSSRAVADLQLAILQGDESVLTAVSGVGKKLAARIVLELKEKVSTAGGAGARGGGGGAGGGWWRQWRLGVGGQRGAPGARLHRVRGARGRPRRGRVTARRRIARRTGEGR